jgi:peptidoglycan hydrolase CwlO-like protein
MVVKKMSKFKYPKGSEWRLWDLHVHTKSEPGYIFSSNHTISTKEQNDDEYPKVFIETIYSIEGLGAIAITDHNNADWIDRIIEENEAFYTQHHREKITIFPGVEIESSDGIHLLVIFNPETHSDVVKRDFRRATWRETIEHFLTVIQITSTNNSPKTTEEIMEEAEKWDAICIFAHVTSDKGFFRISSGSSKKRIYKHRLTQIFQKSLSASFTEGQKNIIEGRDPQYCDDKDILKSICCITSSDAKSLTDIGRNNLWIKADPTFEGLKQIIYEPQERVYIGEEPPRKIERNKVIKSITISNSNNWFGDKPIPLNEGLISIIGGKGTGKTAILDLIAYATGSYKCYEKDENKSKSFLKKAFKELRGTKIKVEWEDGNSDEKEIKDKLEEFIKEGKVRYLPQDYVDQLCSEIGKNELEKQIEDVIFQKIPPEDKSVYTNFQSYKDAQLKVINNNKKRIAGQIQDINSQIYQHNLLIKLKPAKNEEIKKVEEEIKRFESEIEKISEAIKDSKEQKEILTKLQSLTEKKSNLEKTISQLKTKLLKIEEIKSEVAIFLENSKAFLDELKKDLEDVGIKKEVIEKVRVVLYPEDFGQILDERKKIIETEIEKKQTELKETLRNIKEENSKIKLEKSKQDKIKEINKRLSELRKKKDSLYADLKEIETQV